MADSPENTPAPKGDMHIGTAKPVDKAIKFDGHNHPKLAEAEAVLSGKMSELHTAVMGVEKIEEKWAEAMKPLSDAERQTAQSLRTSLDANDIASYLDHEVPANVRTRVNAFLNEHGGEKFKEVTTAQRNVGKEAIVLRKAQEAHLGGLKELGHLKGDEYKAAAAEFKRETKMLDRVANPTFLKNNYAVAREDGWVAALKKNVSKTFIKEHPGKFALKVGGTGIGVIMMGDAIVHGQRQGDDGKPVDRGTLSRLAEFVVGGGLTVGSAFHGGR